MFDLIRGRRMFVIGQRILRAKEERGERRESEE
jgi:hypothetical protein